MEFYFMEHSLKFLQSRGIRTEVTTVLGKIGESVILKVEGVSVRKESNEYANDTERGVHTYTMFI
jgi:hypothetical protein